jgi:hypothetical protein
LHFGELWSLIERHRASPNLRVSYYSGRFGLSDRFATIYDGDEQVMNVPVGEIGTDKIVFVWDDSYAGGVWDKLREATMPAGCILKNLLSKKLIRSSPRVKALIRLAKSAERVEIYKEDGMPVGKADTYEELVHMVHNQVQRDRGLIPR